MSHILGHLQRFNPVFVRHVPHPGTPPTPFLSRQGLGNRRTRGGPSQSPPQRQPCSRRTAYTPAAVPRKNFFFFLLNALHPLLPVLVETLPTRLPHSTKISHDMPHVRGPLTLLLPGPHQTVSIIFVAASYESPHTRAICFTVALKRKAICRMTSVSSSGVSISKDRFPNRLWHKSGIAATII